MKKLLVFILILFTFGVSAQNTYLSTSSALLTKKGTLGEKVAFGGILHHTTFGALVETRSGSKRQWYIGVEAGQNFPVSTTIDFYMGANGKVDVSYKSHKDLLVEPQGGFQFHISKTIAFLALYGAEFAAPHYKLNEARGVVDFGMHLRF